jgi:transcriptional regulator with XRE-family HTH domain
MYKVEEEYERYVQEIGGRIISSEDPCTDIRKTRTSLGITQEELGTLMNLRRETISRIENGSINPTFEFVKRFSKTAAIAKVVRDLQALEEVSIMRGENVASLPPGLLRMYLKIPLQDLKLISEIGIRGYQKSRTKIIKKMKSGV